eukprot:gene16707-5129_t
MCQAVQKALLVDINEVSDIRSRFKNDPNLKARRAVLVSPNTDPLDPPSASNDSDDSMIYIGVAIAVGVIILIVIILAIIFIRRRTRNLREAQEEEERKAKDKELGLAKYKADEDKTGRNDNLGAMRGARVEIQEAPKVGPRVFAWGRGMEGQLGIGQTGLAASLLVPREVPLDRSGFKEVIDIACGSFHTVVALRTAVFSFGENSDGRLGLGHRKNIYAPQQVLFFD